MFSRCTENIGNKKKDQIKINECHPLPDSYTEWYLHTTEYNRRDAVFIQGIVFAVGIPRSGSPLHVIILYEQGGFGHLWYHRITDRPHH